MDSILREVGCSNGTGYLFYLSMIQVTCESLEQHTSLPYFDLQVSFRGNFTPIEVNEQALSDTVVGE